MIWEMTWKIPWGLTLDSKTRGSFAVHSGNAIYVRCRPQRSTDSFGTHARVCAHRDLEQAAQIPEVPSS